MAADLYEREVGSLTRESQFGTNSFQTEQDQGAAEAEFSRSFPDVTVLLDNAVNNQPDSFKNGLRHLIDVTRRVSQRVAFCSWFVRVVQGLFVSSSL